MIESLQNTAVMAIAYLGPVKYFSKLALFPEIIFERYENYSKQSYRNRCAIYTANGIQTLSIPVKKGSSHKTLIRDVEIDYETNWQKLHIRAIEAAYRSAPYYLFYLDDFLPFYKSKPKFLFDLDIEITQTALKIIGASPQFSYTKDYLPAGTYLNDYRNAIHPKQRADKPDSTFVPVRYTQVFEKKHGFVSNLSIIDLIFNTGPDALQILKNSYVRH